MASKLVHVTMKQVLIGSKPPACTFDNREVLAEIIEVEHIFVASLRQQQAIELSHHSAIISVKTC